MNNKLLPWLILVPKRTAIREIYELSIKDQGLVQKESSFIAQLLMQHYKGDKLNVASLGNMVPQLHLHHIVRYQHDSVWPNPVWGNISSKPYSQSDAKQELKQLRKLIGSQIQGHTALVFKE